MDHLEERFGEGMAKIRRDRNLTQAQLAEIIDCSVSLIGQLERGIKKPSLNSFIRIADALGVGLDEFRITCELNTDNNSEEMSERIGDYVAGLKNKKVDL